MPNQIKAVGLLAIVLSISGVAFQLFVSNTVGRARSIFSFASSGVEAMGALFVVFALVFLYHFFR